MWVARWLAAAGNLGRMRSDIEDLKRAGGDPLRCTACGARLKVTVIQDIEGLHGGQWGEELELRCDTAACVFTPRKRQVQFRDP